MWTGLHREKWAGHWLKYLWKGSPPARGTQMKLISNQQISLSTTVSLSKVRASQCSSFWSSFRTVKDKHSNRQENVIILQSLCWIIVLMKPENSAYKTGHCGYVAGQRSSKRFNIRTVQTQIHWVTRTFNPINFHREGRLITSGSP